MNKVAKKQRTLNQSLVCMDGQCIEFDCQDRVKIYGNNVFCGDKLYYEFSNNTFVNKNE